MARLPRIVVPYYPLHIMHRGNNRQDIFENDEDMHRIKDDIETSLSRTKCALHAYVVMTNHLHLLLTPPDKESLASFMQSMANRYVRYFNATRKRSGTIWEGRYKSCLVDTDNYLLTLYRYIELNPLRAGIVETLSDYKWSSYHHNARGVVDKLITEHSLYQDLGRSDEGRINCYRALFDENLLDAKDKNIVNATIRGEVLGDEHFHKKITKLVSRPTKLTAHGGDRRSEKYRIQAG